MISGIALVLLYLSNLTFCDERGARAKRIVGGIAAEEPLPDDPTIFTNFGGKAARIQGIVDYPHYVFRGIKYAYAPVGKDRFLRPREKLLNGLVNATIYAPPCIQPRPGSTQIIGSEDCLALNVFTPELPTGTEGLPVVVWIHGGGFRYGSASQYGVTHLVGKRLVVVTIQYRLGSLGFLSSGSKHLPGNVALWDMALAVQWVRNYIGFFGGNPYKIVVMGQGTGASSALFLALSNIAKGLAGVVAMSGTAVSGWAVDNTPQITANDIAAQNGCPTVDPLTMVKCLQTLSPEHIIKGDSKVEFSRLNQKGFMAGLTGGTGTAPVTEGANDGRALPGLIQENAVDQMEDGKFKNIPLLTGITRDETKRAVQGPMKDDIQKTLKAMPNFLNTDFLQKLKEVVPVKVQLDLQKIQKKFEESFQQGIANLENIISKLVPPNFNNYLKVQSEKIGDILKKVSDVTNDALFNVPAFVTVDKWGINGAPTYLYSFEHLGSHTKGNAFLKGSPLIGNDTHFHELNDTIGHGDDLAYLFDAYDLQGQPLEHSQVLSEEDKQVRETFTQMIADFARYGAPRMNDKPVQPFSAKLNNFIQIKAKSAIGTNFKFCETALWCNIAEKLKSSTCDFLQAIDSSFKNMQKFVQALKNQTDISNNKIIEQLSLLKNLSGQGVNIFGQPNLNNLAPDKILYEINQKWKNVTDDLRKKLPPIKPINIFDPSKGLPNIFDIKKQEPLKLPNLFDIKIDPAPGLANIFQPNQEQPKLPNLFDIKNEPIKIPNLFEKKQGNNATNISELPNKKNEPPKLVNLFEIKQDSSKQENNVNKSENKEDFLKGQQKLQNNLSENKQGPAMNQVVKNGVTIFSANQPTPPPKLIPNIFDPKQVQPQITNLLGWNNQNNKNIGGIPNIFQFN